LKETNGRVKISVFPNNQLGGDTDMLKYISMTRRMWDGFIMLANGRNWKSLPADVQKVIAKNLNGSAEDQRADYGFCCSFSPLAEPGKSRGMAKRRRVAQLWRNQSFKGRRFTAEVIGRCCG
jgi:hypothetical protein